MPARLAGTVNLMPQAGQQKVIVSCTMVLWQTTGPPGPRQSPNGIHGRLAVWLFEAF